MPTRRTEKRVRKQVINRNADGTFGKGTIGNPNGRPEVSAAERLLKALNNATKIKGQSLFDRFVEQAYNDPKILVALMKKFVPDLSSMDASIQAEMFGSFGLHTLTDAELAAEQAKMEARDAK